MTELIVEDAPAPQPHLATLEQLKKQITVTRDVHDSQLELYLHSASNKVRDMVTLDPAADPPPEATLATLLYAQYLWETTQRRSARRDDDPDSVIVNPLPEMRRLLGLPTTDAPPEFAGSVRYR